MRKDSNTAQRKPQQKDSHFLFWLITVLHYLMGLFGLYFAALLAVNPAGPDRFINGGIAAVFTILFALTQPDIRFRKIDTGLSKFSRLFTEN